MSRSSAASSRAARASRAETGLKLIQATPEGKLLSLAARRAGRAVSERSTHGSEAVTVLPTPPLLILRKAKVIRRRGVVAIQPASGADAKDALDIVVGGVLVVGGYAAYRYAKSLGAGGNSPTSAGNLLLDLSGAGALYNGLRGKLPGGL